MRDESDSSSRFRFARCSSESRASSSEFRERERDMSGIPLFGFRCARVRNGGFWEFWLGGASIDSMIARQCTAAMHRGGRGARALWNRRGAAGGMVRPPSVRPPPARRPPSVRPPPVLPAGKRRAGYEPRRCFECRTRPRCGLHQADDESSSTTDFPVPETSSQSCESLTREAAMLSSCSPAVCPLAILDPSFRQSEGNHGVRLE